MLQQCAACSCNNNSSNNNSRKKGDTEVFVFLVDATVVQNAVASVASVASSPTPVFILASVGALSGVDVAAANLKAKLND